MEILIIHDSERLERRDQKNNELLLELIPIGVQNFSMDGLEMKPMEFYKFFSLFFGKYKPQIFSANFRQYRSTSFNFANNFFFYSIGHNSIKVLSKNF